MALEREAMEVHDSQAPVWSIGNQFEWCLEEGRAKTGEARLLHLRWKPTWLSMMVQTRHYVFDINTCLLRQLLFHLRPLTHGDRCSRSIVLGILLGQSGGSSFVVVGLWIMKCSIISRCLLVCILCCLLSSMRKINHLCWKDPFSWRLSPRHWACSFLRVVWYDRGM